MNRDEWLREFCSRIGVSPPTEREAAELLELAATAAHASERPAAPLTCWAAGRSSRSVAELKRIAEEVSGQRQPM